ncbi:MAG: hypothetical protein PW843_24295 [Azospirillaceae bacterium]|nr:hypothetical protein [Azospirillaceae bacterium]
METKFYDLTGEASPQQQQAILMLSKGIYRAATDLGGVFGPGITLNALITAYVNMAMKAVGAPAVADSLRQAADILDAEGALKQ